MGGSGLDKLLSKAFAGVDSMLLGKKYPMNMHALHFVVLEVIRDIMKEVDSYQELFLLLDALSAKSLLAEHWIKNLIRPVLIMMLYVQAEREGDFTLRCSALLCIE